MHGLDVLLIFCQILVNKKYINMYRKTQKSACVCVSLSAYFIAYGNRGCLFCLDICIVVINALFSDSILCDVDGLLLLLVIARIMHSALKSIFFH